MGFFRFLSQHFVLVYANGEKVRNVIDDDIYNRIIEFKAKNEIINMNRDYSNIDKKVWSVKYVPEQHAYNKNNASFVNVD